MGFTRSLPSSTGTGTFASAYHKIGDVHIDWHTKRARFSLRIFEDKAARDADKQQIGQRMFTIPQPGSETTFDEVLAVDQVTGADKNYLKQLYSHAKTVINDPEIVDVDPD